LHIEYSNSKVPSCLNHISKQLPSPESLSFKSRNVTFKIAHKPHSPKSFLSMMIMIMGGSIETRENFKGRKGASYKNMKYLFSSIQSANR